jgi:hypothetical protein
MARRRTAADDRRRRKMITFLWTGLLALGTIILIYKEQTALLYIIATLGITALLVIVAVSDLGHAEKLTSDPRAAAEAAAADSGARSPGK